MPKIEVVGSVFEANGLVEEQQPRLERCPSGDSGMENEIEKGYRRGGTDIVSKKTHKHLVSIDDTSFMEITSASKGQPAAHLPCIH